MTPRRLQRAFASKHRDAKIAPPKLAVQQGGSVRRGILAFLAALWATPLAAQDSSAYDALVAVLASNESFDIASRRLLEVDLPAAFRSDPNIQEIEAECPGAVEALLVATTPMFKELDQEGRRDYRAALRNLLPTRMSEADARAAAEFFGSDLGQKFVRSISEQSTLSNSLSSAMSNDEGSIDRDAFERDQLNAARGGLEALSDFEKLSVNRALQTSWGEAINDLSPEIMTLKYSIMNAEMTPDQNAALDAVIGETIDAHFDACEASDD
jgi:hypothetical protein